MLLHVLCPLPSLIVESFSYLAPADLTNFSQINFLCPLNIHLQLVLHLIAMYGTMDTIEIPSCPMVVSFLHSAIQDLIDAEC